MINCYKDPKDKDGVIVELEGDCIDISLGKSVPDRMPRDGAEGGSR